MLAIRNVSGEDVTGAANIANYNPLRYRGYYYDSETGLYYLKSRYYDPITKRFLNADTIVCANKNSAQGTNLFEYCNNDPINKSDNNGNWPQWAKKIGQTIKNRIINPIKKIVVKVKNSFANTKVLLSSRPYKGKPGSTYKDSNGNTRTYGPDGLPQHDYDSNDHGNPSKHPHDSNGGHNHDWENGVRGPAYAMNFNALIGISLVTVGTVSMFILLADDATGFGIADNVLLYPAIDGVVNGVKLIYG